MNGILLTFPQGDRSGEQLCRQAYDPETLARLGELLHMPPPILSLAELEQHAEAARQADFLFSTWGMPSLNIAQIERYFPRLRAVFYAAGTVRAFALPFLKKGVRVFSAAAVNAVPVAEYTAAQILLANKGFFQAATRYRSAGWQDARAYHEGMPGNYGSFVGLLGAGAIGGRVAELLRSHSVRVMVYDPFLSQARARELGVEQAELEPLFSACSVISNHLADNEQTKGILDYRLFSKMGPRAVFLNTGRGAQVVEEDLARALREQPERTALLDVTAEEPIPPSSPLLPLPNAILTPHIAGSSAGEIARMGHFALHCCQILLAGGQPEGEVTVAMLHTMA